MSMIVLNQPKNFTGCALVGKKSSIYMPAITRTLEFNYFRDGIYIVNRVSKVAFFTFRERILEFLKSDFAEFNKEEKYSVIFQFYISDIKQLSIELFLKENSESLLTGISNLSTGLTLSLFKLVKEQDFRIEYMLECIEDAFLESPDWHKVFYGSNEARFTICQDSSFRFCISFDTDKSIKDNENYRIYMYVGLEVDKNNSVLLDMTLYVGYGIKKDNKIYLFKERNGILRVVILDGRDFPELKGFDNVIGLSLADVVSGKWIAIVE